MENIYITTPIYYVNDKPHIGHAYTSLACDVLSRFMRLEGNNVRFLTGTDEHGQKVEKSAEAKGIPAQQFTDEVSEHFRNLATLMQFTNDDFIRTTEERHKKGAQAFWDRLKEKGYIYEGTYAGWYSVRDEAFYAESELVDGKAPSGAEVEWVEESSYFFKLSAFQDRLLELYEEQPDFIFPATRRNEVISFVRGGKKKEEGALKDLSISRTGFSWGVPVPNDDSHVMYVWLDALTNYITSLGYPDEGAENYQNFWEHTGSHSPIHVVGKDILRFHAVYWPAFLMAAEMPLPKQIVAHGWWTNEGQKISKSVGNIIDPIALVDEFGLDQTRYFLMAEVPFGNDGNFSKDRMIHRMNTELANNIGNLVQRTLSMIQKNCDAKVPANDDPTGDDEALRNTAYATINAVREKIEKHAYHSAIEQVVQLASKANEYIDKQAPWVLKKENPERMATVLYTLAEAIRCLGILLQPFIPTSAGKILDLLEIPENQRGFDNLDASHALASGTELPKPEGIFPRHVEQEREAS